LSSPLRSLRAVTALAGLLACLPAAAQTAPAAPPSTLALDATEASRQILHAHLTLPVGGGPLTLLYPKWIPGEHGPTGPLPDLTGLRFHLGATEVPWQRDPVDMYAFHLTVPGSGGVLAADLDFLSPEEGQFSAGASSTPELSVLSWNTVVLYPQGRPADEIPFAASLKLPPGWKYATALPVEGDGDGTVRFKTASLTTLVDSPVLIGEHLKVVPIAEGPRHEIDLVADSAAALIAPADLAPLYGNLVAETGALFGSRHYRDYHWLVTLSDKVAHFGLEHHESSDDRTDEPTLGDAGRRRNLAGLLAHEFAHSWNGKYRRPAGLVDPDYHEPMRGNLLWVYEGLTEYLGYLLPARSGLWTPEYYREEVAATAAALDHEPGRTWRSLADTAVAAQILYGSAHAWASWRRGTDFYDESLLIWLEADMLIRRETQGKRSLDDFCRLFYGGPGVEPAVKPYTFDDVVAALGQVARYDWRGFFAARLESLDPHAPLGGLRLAGWKLVYDESPNQAIADREARAKWFDWSFSLGFSVRDDGTFRDVVPGSPAAKAGLAPGMKLVAVDGRAWSKERLDIALAAHKGDGRPFEILATDNDFYRTYAVDYHGGVRYPHLVRDSGPDLLAILVRPLARREGTKK
jgi:predicted metalloprotease with PDZ domain